MSVPRSGDDRIAPWPVVSGAEVHARGDQVFGRGEKRLISAAFVVMVVGDAHRSNSVELEPSIRTSPRVMPLRSSELVFPRIIKVNCPPR